MYINVTFILKSIHLIKPRILHIKRQNKENKGYENERILFCGIRGCLINIPISESKIVFFNRHFENAWFIKKESVYSNSFEIYESA